MEKALRKDIPKKDFQEAVIKYLDFVPRHRELAEAIAVETVDQAYKDPREPSGRTARLTLQQKVILATHACIRHSYTAYDDVLIETPNEQQACPVIDEMDEEIYEEPANEVQDFIRKHRS